MKMSPNCRNSKEKELIVILFLLVKLCYLNQKTFFNFSEKKEKKCSLIVVEEKSYFSALLLLPSLE